MASYQNQVHSLRTRSTANPTVEISLIALFQFKYSFDRTLLSFTLFFPIQLFLDNKRVSYWLLSFLFFFFFSCRPFRFSPQTAQGGGHRTLLYGHAILLRHSYSGMYLCCLSTSRSSTDKLAFDVGLQEDTTGEACWWTIHPASKQRSEGEKVRVGDDLILVSVSSERYLVSGPMLSCVYR